MNSTTRGDAPPATSATDAVQRRVLRSLVASQVLSGAGLAAGVTVGALLAQDMLGSTGLAGLPSALLTAGAAVAAVLVGRVSQSGGRRRGLAAGYLVGAVGSAGVVLAAVLDLPVLLFAALFVYGAGTATNLQARYAGADLAPPGRRGRAVSTVLVATTLGGVAGPNLVAPSGSFAAALGAPELAGPFLLAGVAYALAAAVLTLTLRPDPLLLARSLAAAQGDTPQDAGATAPAAAPPAPTPGDRRGVATGAAVMVLTQLVMVAVMTMTPIHMHDHGHTTAASGLVIAVHIAAMYLPSPVTGRLVDRYGSMPVAAASGVTLLAAGVLAGLAPGDSVVLLASALALLGLGWNFGLLAGTAIVTDTVPLATRARTQGTVDVAVAVAGATGGMSSGLVMATAGFPLLALAGGALALAVVPAVLLTARRG
ncbi:MFS transporter [Streptomyces lonarensis]|uniref:MFS transporter n=1 Tax=Streptomyces lonarensis TaxID=700599 RepID=A0A7X6D2X4_9ACTN|nr:MFS transporter [Streptomyces lonarensis]NJQ07120.1 MFS transporter [Streptomyces lonarensis]